MTRSALLEDNGLKHLISELARQAHRATTDEAHSVLLTLLTLGSRLPLTLALDSLTARERAVLSHVFAMSGILFVPADRPPSATARSQFYTVCIGKSGRIQLFPGDGSEGAPGAHDFVVGHLAVPGETEEVILEEAGREQLVETFYARVLSAELMQSEAAGELPAKLDSIRDWVTHVEAVYFFVGRQAYGHSESLRNLVAHAGAHGVLDGVECRPVSDWPMATRIIVVALWCLFKSGRAVRYEEFCGRQLTAARLYRWLLEKCVEYSHALGEEFQPPALGPGAFGVLAEQAQALCRRCDVSPFFRFRRVYGLTYLKTERLASRSDIPDLDEIPAPVTAFVEAALETNYRAHAGHEPFLRAAAIEAAVQDATRPAERQSSVEQLLGSIVLSAALASDSDYAMSSSLRNFADLKPAATFSTAGRAAQLTTSSFYCCCLPHPRLLGLLSQEALSAILSKVAQRMEFNRWHFVVGNFAREEVPDKRHYFYPPLLPDISSWSDQQHSGHARAGVRYSVRAPGPPMFCAPFRLWGHDYRGFFDMRLVRQEGPPFTLREMAIAVQHCQYIGVVLGALRDVQEASGTEVAIRGFDSAWYGSASWFELVGDLVAPVS
jgi:hypothetical protein